MGLEAWRALGDFAQLPAWNAALERLGDEYEAVANKDVDEQTSLHLEGLRPLLQALSRHVAIKAGDPDLFPKIEAAFRNLNAPDDWSKRWWEVPFSAALGALYGHCRDAVAGVDPEALPEAESVRELRDALVERGVEIDVDPYETARVNREGFGKALLEVHDLHRAWVEVRAPESAVPDRPTPTELGSGGLPSALVGGRVLTPCIGGSWETRGSSRPVGKSTSPAEVGERLGLDEAAVATKSRERAELRTRKRHASRRRWRSPGKTFEIETIDYVEPVERGHLGGLGGTDRAACEGRRIHAARDARRARRTRRGRRQEAQELASATAARGGAGGRRRGRDTCLPLPAQGIRRARRAGESVGIGDASEGSSARREGAGRDERRTRLRLPLQSRGHRMAR